MAYVLSSVSGNLISAASAGYAPTNSGDVSAIASAYQVVSSTATQLYAGTAYVTSVNEAPVSAERAGNAANASMANSAYYDGTGRLISALPDSAAVSAIASSYVESGVSSKQDTLSFAYNTADQISSINGSALGGMDEAAVSGIASAYAESAVSSKADSSALSSYVPYSGLEYYGTAISGIDGSSLYDYSAHARITTVAGRVTSLSAEMSSKADESALSGYYTTANESGFITGVDLTDYATTAYVDSAVSSKADSSALSSYVPYSSLEYNTASAISGINGSALAAGSTYSAGEGINITDDVISVETPVDVVAGPGIVIDNPDGNTMRISTDENYKTLLYTASAYSATLELSESPSNFEYLELEMVNNNGTTLYPHQICRITIPGNEFGVAYRTVTYQTINYPVSDWFYAGSISGTTISITRRQMFWHTLSGNDGGVNQGADIYPTKIYGVHRINGGN